MCGPGCRLSGARGARVKTSERGPCGDPGAAIYLRHVPSAIATPPGGHRRDRRGARRSVAIPAPRSTSRVDLELVLAVDISGSIDDEEAKLQRQGYVSALTHPDIVAAIGRGFLGRIAVTYFEWAGAENSARGRRLGG